MQLIALDPFDPTQKFPESNLALTDPNGLLAIGGCLSPQRLLNAYRHGIFPWYNEGEPILWWSPNPRLVLFPDAIKISRSLRKTINRQTYQLSVDQAFSQVISACAEPRANQQGTWISAEMNDAYNKLHQLGSAHSVEAWLNDELVGGLYGIAIGQVFFGESMFHTKTDASKVAFVYLTRQLKQWGYQLIDCQVYSSHLVSLGAEEIDRQQFNMLLDQFCPAAVKEQAWKQ